jgi:hypothetical protein
MRSLTQKLVSFFMNSSVFDRWWGIFNVCFLSADKVPCNQGAIVRLPADRMISRGTGSELLWESEYVWTFQYHMRKGNPEGM